VQEGQSRAEATAGRAFYTCAMKWILNKDGFPDEYNMRPCYFQQWIDGPDKFDPRIRLFRWQKSVVQPYHEFRRWVPPPPNPPPMTFEEKQEARCKRASSPPLYHCGSRSKLMHPNIELPEKFTPFFRCRLTTHVIITSTTNLFLPTVWLRFCHLQTHLMCCAGWMAPM